MIKEKNNGNSLTCIRAIYFLNLNTNIFTCPFVWIRLKENCPFFLEREGDEVGESEFSGKLLQEEYVCGGEPIARMLLSFSFKTKNVYVELFFLNYNLSIPV